MLFNTVCFESFGYELPEDIVSSEEIEQRLSPVYDRLRLPYGRLEMMSGIKERRFWKEGTLPSTVSIQAAEKAIEQSGISRDDIGCLIYGAVCRDFLEPATASVVHSGLNLPSYSMLFDVSNACLGFLNGIILLANMIELGQVKAGIVVAGESSRQLVESTIKSILEDKELTRKNFKYYFASLTIGSGAAAVVLAHSSLSKTHHRLIGGQVKADTDNCTLCVGGAEAEVAHSGEVTMRTDSETLLVNGIQLASETWKKTKEELGWNNDSINKVFCHQVGAAHKKMVYESLNLDSEKDFSTYEFLGNVGSVSLPITMAMGIENGLLKKNDKATLLGIGSGINCVMLGVEW